MLIAGAKYCPNESAQIWGEHRVGIAEVGKYVVPCYSSSSENSPHCEAEGLISREQNCPVLPDGTGSCLLCLAVKCQGLPGSACCQLDLLKLRTLWWCWPGRLHGCDDFTTFTIDPYLLPPTVSH